MPPFQRSSSAPADTRFLEPRQVDDLIAIRPISFEPNRLEARSEPVDISQEDFTLRLLLSKRNAPTDGLTRRSEGQLVERQGVIRIIPTVYQGLNDGPAPGTVVGIVLGSVAGFLILIWLLWLVSNGSGTLIRTEGDIEEVDVVRRRSRSPRSRRTRSRRQEMSIRGGSPRRVVRTERIVRDFGDRSPSPSILRDRSRVREQIIVEESRPERRFDGDDEVVVIEEHSEPRRERRRRESGSYRSVTEERIRERFVESDAYDEDPRISGSYRVVDPRQPGGGSFKPHRMR